MALKDEVKKIYDSIDNPTDTIQEVKNKTSGDFLKDNVLNSVILTLEKVFETDAKIEKVMEKIMDKLDTDDDINFSDLFKFLTILQDYRLSQYNSAIDPFKGTASNSLMNEQDKDNQGMQELSKSLSGKDLRKLRTLTDNLDKIVDFISDVPENFDE